MAFQKQTDDLLGGGLNLVAPLDKLGDGEALVCRNFRPDQAGALRSRRGIRSESASMGIIHSMIRYGAARYAGVGTELRYGTDLATTLATGLDGERVGIFGAQGFAWAMNRNAQKRAIGPTVYNWGIVAPASAPTVVAGSRVETILAEFDSTETEWDVARFDNNELRENPTFQVTLYDVDTVAIENASTTVLSSFVEWIAAYVGANITITNAAGDVHDTTIAAVPAWDTITLTDAWPFATEASMRYRIWKSSTAKDFDASNKVFGTHSLHVAANPAGRWQVYRDWSTAKDTRIAAAARNADVFGVWFYASNPQAITAIRLVLRSGTGANRPAVAVELPGAALNQQAFTWTHLEIPRGYDPDAVLNADPAYRDLMQRIADARDAGSDLEQELEVQRVALRTEILSRVKAFAPTTGTIDWAAVTGAFIEVETSEPCDFHLDRLTIAGGAAASLVGEFFWYVTYVNDDEMESNPSPVSATVTLNQQPATITIPVAPDPQVTRRYLYRGGTGLGEARRAKVVFDNTATTVVDDVGQEDVEGAELLPVDNDPPPAAAGACLFLGRAVAWLGNRAYWSEVAKLYAWPGVDDATDGNWQDVGEAGEDIVWCVPQRRALWVLKQRSIWRYDGDPDQVDPVKTAAEVGVAGPSAWVEVGGGVMLCSAEGLYLFNGEIAEDVSGPLKPLFRGDYVDIGGSFMPPISRTYRRETVLGYREGRLYLSYVEEASGATKPNRCLVLENGKWMEYRPGTGSGFTMFHHEGADGEMLAGLRTLSAGQLVTLDVGETDLGSAVPLVWRTGFRHQGLPNANKRYADVVIEGQTGQGAQTAATVTARLILNNGAEAIVLGTFSSLAIATKVFRIEDGDGKIAKNAALDIEGAASATVLIRRAYLHWYPYEREALTWDTGEIDLGRPGPKLVDQITVEATIPVAIESRFFSDSSGVLATTGPVTQAIAGVAGRRTVDIRPRVDSKHIRGRMFRQVMTGSDPFQVHAAWIRWLPLLLSLKAGEAWTSPVIDFGRVVELKDLTISWFSPGTAPFSYSIDGAAPVTVTLPAAVDRKTDTFALSGRGRTVVFSCATPIDIAAASFRFRVLGGYFNGANGETWAPGPIYFNGEENTFRDVVLEIENAATATLALAYDGGSFTKDIPAGARRVVTLRVPGTIKTATLTPSVTSAGVVVLYGGKLWGRPLRYPYSWQWYDLPIVPTSDGATGLQTRGLFGGDAAPDDWIVSNLPVDVLA